MVEVNLVIVAGTTADYRLDWQKRDEDGTTTPVDMTGWKAVSQIRSYDTLILDLSPYVTLSEQGSITISIPTDTSKSLAAGRYAWDLLLTNPEGATVRMFKGWVRVETPLSKETL